MITSISSIINMQEKYDKAMQSIAEMQKRVVMAESMLEATLQYESGQSKALSSPRYNIILVIYEQGLGRNSIFQDHNNFIYEPPIKYS